MDRLKNIVAGVDFSKCSQAALAQAARLAQENKARLHVLHVIEDLVVEDLEQALQRPAEDIQKSVHDAALRRLERLIVKARLPKCPLIREVVFGNPFAEILHRVQAVSADLLVLGARGYSSFREGAGTLATQCVRKAAAKVLLVREGQAGKFKKIVAGVDFSDTSRLVIEQAVRLAKKEKARLCLLHVFFPPWQALHYRMPTPEASPDFMEQYRESLEARLEQFFKPFQSQASGLKVEYRLAESSSAAGGVNDFIARYGADLVVVGTRGRTGLAVLLLGTTAERVIRESTVAVLAIKPAGFKFKI